jgi:hypothetical protein
MRRTPVSVVLLGTQAQPVVLRDSALAVWDCFATPHEVDEVSRSLAIRYRTPLPDLREDVTRLVADLVDIQVLTPVPNVR